MIRINYNILVFVILCLVLGQLRAQNKGSIQHKLQFKLDSLQKANGFPGVTFSVILADGQQISVASGVSDSISKTPMKSTHRMLSGSNGKMYFAAAALQLASQNYFSLDDKISKFLHDESWFTKLPNRESITMRMLLNHTSGIEEYLELGDFMTKLKNNPNKSFTPYESLSYLFNRKPLFEAGTQWSYADANYILMAYILEKISGKKMYDYIKKEFINPNNLNRTEPSIKREFKDLATGYGRKNSPFPFEGAMVKNKKLVLNPQFEWAGGGFVSNVQDLAKWSKLMFSLNGINENLLSEMKVKVPANTGKNHNYGLGIQIRPSDFGDSYGHSGWFPGYLTDAVYFPDKNIAMAIQFITDDVSKLKMMPYSYVQLLTKVIVEIQQN